MADGRYGGKRHVKLSKPKRESVCMVNLEGNDLFPRSAIFHTKPSRATHYFSGHSGDYARNEWPSRKPMLGTASTQPTSM